MPAAFDSRERFSFAGIEVPAESYDIVGGLRDHVHEYPHQDGGDPEKMGRKLYVVRARLNFASGKYKLYPDLWPNGINRLMQLFELGGSHNLVLPTIKPIVAYAKDWTRTMTARVRSGEMMQVEFREDATNLPLPLPITAPAPASVGTGASALAARLAGLGLPSGDIGLFDALQNVVAGIVAIKDTASLGGSLLAQKIAQAANLCRQIDSLTSMQDPSQVSVVDALHDLWVQLVQLQNDLLSQNVALQSWVVPMTMPMSSASTYLYGDTSHTEDLLALNSGAYADPNEIPAGTTLVYYPDPIGLRVGRG